MPFVKLTPASGKVTGTHSNMPALIVPSLISGVGTLTTAEANSVRFYSDVSKTTELAREVVSADEIHVKVSSLSGTTDIYMDWDGIRSDYAVTDTYGRNAVWSDYQAVYHLQSLTNNSSSGSYTLTNTNSVANASGKILDGADFSSTNTNKRLNTSSSLGFVSGSYSFTAWARLSSTTYATGDNMMSVFELRDATAKLSLAMYRTRVSGVDYLQFSHSRWATTTVTINTPDLSTSNFTKLDMTYDTSTLRGYQNGSFQNSASISGNGAGSPASGFGIGGVSDSNIFAPFRGIVDEFRLRLSQVSDNWVSTEYQNQNDNGSFWVASTVSSVNSNFFLFL